MAIRNKVITNPKTRQEIRFLQTAKDTLGKLLEMESTYQSYSTEPVAHYHPYQEEDFTVITGELTVRINGKINILKTGDTLHIPKNTVHSMWNASESVTKVNWKVRPAMNTEIFLETAIGLAADGKTNESGVPPFLQSVVLANSYASVFRVAKPPFVIQKIFLLLLTPAAYLAGYRSRYKKYID